LFNGRIGHFHIETTYIIPLIWKKMAGPMNESNGGIVNTLKRVWGVGAPRGFKLGAWAVAFAGFGILYYIENRPTITIHVKRKDNEPSNPSS
jgi:hypothetical protein